MGFFTVVTASGWVQATARTSLFPQPVQVKTAVQGSWPAMPSSQVWASVAGRTVVFLAPQTGQDQTVSPAWPQVASVVSSAAPSWAQPSTLTSCSSVFWQTVQVKTMVPGWRMTPSSQTWLSVTGTGSAALFSPQSGQDQTRSPSWAQVGALVTAKPPLGWLQATSRSSVSPQTVQVKTMVPGRLVSPSSQVCFPVGLMNPMLSLPSPHSLQALICCPIAPQVGSFRMVISR